MSAGAPESPIVPAIAPSGAGCADSDLSVDLWSAKALEALELPDHRLKLRALRCLGALARRPSDSIPQACAQWAMTKGTYRFLGNERVSAAALRAGSGRSAVRACAGHKVILAPQDSTSFSMPKAHETKGLGLVGNHDVRGFYLHSMLLLDETGLPMALAAQRTWVREQWRTISPAQRKRLPIEEKESHKWLDLIEQVRATFTESFSDEERPYIIHICDREGDIHEVFADLQRHGEGFAIRSNQNRAVRDASGVAGKAHTLVARATLLGLHVIDVPRKHNTRARTATLEVRAAALSLQSRCLHHPERRSGPAVTLNLVEAREVNCPCGHEPLHWRLWTSEPSSTFEQCLRVIEIYTERWKVEDYHLVLKSGCGMEELRLKTLGALEKALVLYGLVAVRIMRMRDLARATPEAPCTEVLHDLEWRVLQTQVNQSPPHPQDPPPTLRQAVLWIGRLGGHLGRKGDGMPGVRLLWKGLRDLELLVAQARILLRHPNSFSPPC